MKVDLNNPIIQHKNYSLLDIELKENQVLNSVAKKHLKKIKEKKDKKKIAVITNSYILLCPKKKYNYFH